MTTIVVIHTGPVTVDPLKAQFAEQFADARIVNIVDDSLLADVRSAGRLTPEVTRRLYSYMANAEALGADIILNACSSVGEATDLLRSMIRTPIVKVDEAMAEEACALGPRIGVVATVSTTLEPRCVSSAEKPPSAALRYRSRNASRKVHSKRCLRARPRSTTTSSSARLSSSLNRWM